MRTRTQIQAGLLALFVGLAVPTGMVGAQESGNARSASAVDSLVARGLLQEAAWLARENGDTAVAETILQRLDSILRAPPVHAKPLAMESQGVSYTFRLNHGGGVESIFKVDGSDIFCPDCGVDREVASYQVDRLLGLDLTPLTVPTRIVDEAGDTLTGSTMYFMHGASNPREVGATKPDLLRFFDAVIGNSDRHQSNWLVLANGRVVAIDHNRAFQYRPQSRPKTCWETEVDSIARPARLGVPLERYRTLPDDSLAAAVADLSPALIKRFVAMRDRVVDRIQQRISRPSRALTYTDCSFGG